MATIRGLWTHAGVLYSVEDARLYSIDSSGFKSALGTLNSGSGIVDFASNLTQMAINDGIYLYVYSPVSGNFSTAVGYPGGDRITFLDQRVVFQYRGTQKFGWTGLGDTTSIGALDFASAESSPDLLVANLAANREIWLFGEDSTEIWDAVGGLTVFARSSAAIDYGCVAAQSAQKTANSVIWLGKDLRGQAQVLSAQGHRAQRISTRAQEELFSSLGNLSAASAYAYTQGGQSFYSLNIPGLESTLVWDETYQQWHERAEWVNGAWAPWRPTCHAFAYNQHYFGGGSTLYTSSYLVNDFAGSPKRRQRISPVVSAPDRHRVHYSSLEVVCEKGTGATAMLRWSDDNGSNWSNWHYATVGEVGEFARRARFTRLGSSRDRVFDLVMTDPQPFNPVAVNVPLA